MFFVIVVRLFVVVDIVVVVHDRRRRYYRRRYYRRNSSVNSILAPRPNGCAEFVINSLLCVDGARPWCSPSL